MACVVVVVVVVASAGTDPLPVDNDPLLRHPLLSPLLVAAVDVVVFAVVVPVCAADVSVVPVRAAAAVCVAGDKKLEDHMQNPRIQVPVPTPGQVRVPSQTEHVERHQSAATRDSPPHPRLLTAHTTLGKDQP